MKVQIIRSKATVQQVKNMLKALETYIKLAVDIERDIIAGGGVLHADCEAVLIDEVVSRRISGEPIGFLQHRSFDMRR